MFINKRKSNKKAKLIYLVIFKFNNKFTLPDK